MLARRHWEIEVYFNQLVELHLDYCLMDTDTSGVAERARGALMENMETMATKMTVWALFHVYEAYCSCGEGEIDESTTGHLRDLLLASLAAVKDPELNIAVLRKRCSLLSQFNRCPSLESPTFQDDTRTFVNKLKNNDMVDRANASMLAIQDPGGFVRYLMEEAGQDKSKLDVVVDVLCSLQVLVDYQLDSILSFAAKPNFESDAFPHFVEHSSRLCARQPDLAHRVALDMPRQLISLDLDLPAQAVTNSVQILENAVNHCQESIGIASIAATSTLLARLHEILPLDASRSEIISPLLRALSQMRAKNNSHHLIQQLLLHPDLANYFVDCNQASAMSTDLRSLVQSHYFDSESALAKPSDVRLAAEVASYVCSHNPDSREWDLLFQLVNHDLILQAASIVTDPNDRGAIWSQVGKRAGGSFEDDISSAMVRAGQVFRMLSGADDGFNSQPLQMCAVHLVDTIIGHKEVTVNHAKDIFSLALTLPDCENRTTILLQLQKFLQDRTDEEASKKLSDEVMP